MQNLILLLIKISEMQKINDVFESNFNYYKRVAHKKNLLLGF
jgi:hypothetical protein